MCEYCKHDPTWSDNPNEVMMPLGHTGRFAKNAMGRFVNTDDLGLNLFLECDDSGAYLKGYVFSDDPLPDEKAIVSAEAKIYYCPMCGRKLD